ncbi:MBL fold metallo-hydrolase [Desertibacillus haloalkaliphilus]|nr:MBL fold metallo-hydrolase [Desertibacillus haloalkaliphilus]
MKYVYCYLFRSGNEAVLLDVGFNYPKAKEAWNDIFHELDLTPTQIKTIYLTHFHPDHSGLAGWMQELTGAPIYMHLIDIAMFKRVWEEDSTQSIKVGNMSLANGVPNQLSKDIVKHMDDLQKHVRPLPILTPLNDSHVVIDGDTWEVIHTPGHSDGHICFYQKDEQLLLVGDHILDKITPNISLWPESDPNPLVHYLSSLEKVRQLDVRIALSAHGDIIEDVSTRIDELIRHHQSRLDGMLGAVQKSTAYEVAKETFDYKTLTPHQWRFAMAETLAHLEYLVNDGKLTKHYVDESVNDQNEPIHYYECV